jgi:hypothetical protein
MIKAFPKDHEESRGIGSSPRDTDATIGGFSFEDFIHDVRQPLGVIESLSFFLELTSTDNTRGPHLRQIRAMVHQAHRILEAALLAQSKPAKDTGKERA